MSKFNLLVYVYRSERQYYAAVQRKKAAKKTLSLIKAIGGVDIPYSGFSCNIEKTVEEFDVFKILQGMIDEK